jgi:flagellar biosynthesis protein FlhF
MKTKTFVAPNMTAAMEQVKKELGMEAIIISVRQVPLGPAWKVWQAPGVEVVAMQAHSGQAIQGKDGPPSVDSNSPAPPAPKNGSAKKTKSTSGPAARQQAFQAALTRSLKEEAEDDSDPDELLNALKPVVDDSQSKHKPASTKHKSPKQVSLKTVSSKPTIPNPVSPKQASNLLSIPWPLVNAQRQLLKQGVDKELVHKVINVCAETLNVKALENEELVQEYLRRQLEAGLRIHSNATLMLHRLICLVGPSGSGKTSLSAKLVTRAAKMRGRKVAWICADTVRAGAIAEARVYTDSLGISLHLAYTPDDLFEAVEAEDDAASIIVDTSACNPYMEKSIVELGATLEALPNRVTYLVAPAVAKEADLTQLLGTFGIFKLDGLVLTKMDETSSFGSVFNLAWRSQLPLAYFTTGTHVIEDLKPADARALTSALFGK